MKCKKGYTVQVLSGNLAGFYIGTVDEDGFPYCRLSEEYYPTREAGTDSLKKQSYTIRRCVENEFCSGNGDCEISS